MNDLSTEVLRALDRRSISDSERAHHLEQAKALSNECGCALGGTFASVTSLAMLAYLLVARGWSWPVLPMGLGFVLVSAFFGKLLGILIAKVRLLNLYWYLSRGV